MSEREGCPTCKSSYVGWDTTQKPHRWILMMDNGYTDRDSAPVRLKFEDLSEEWHRRTAHLSVSSRATRHPLYRQIVTELGVKAIQFILHDLRLYGGDWFPALREITGQDPARGITDYDAAIAAWERWAVNHGYMQRP